MPPYKIILLYTRSIGTKYQKVLGVVAALLGDLIRVVDIQSFLGQTVLNVSFYHFDILTGAGDGYLEEMASAYNDAVVTPMTQLQADDLLHTEREWRNLTNETDLFLDTEVIPGIRTGDPLNSFTSLGFMLNRASLVTRNGFKRIGGLTEDMISGNTVTFPSTTQSDMETGFTAALFDGIIQFGHPIIVKRPIPKPAVSYDFSEISGCSFRRIGTQNTRKAGRGI